MHSHGILVSLQLQRCGEIAHMTGMLSGRATPCLGEKDQEVVVVEFP